MRDAHYHVLLLLVSIKAKYEKINMAISIFSIFLDVIYCYQKLKTLCRILFALTFHTYDLDEFLVINVSFLIKYFAMNFLSESYTQNKLLSLFCPYY